jgi:SAM-dependent methyltransferase
MARTTRFHRATPQGTRGPKEPGMSNDSQSIHEFDFKLICDYYSGLERQGPGSPEVTIKALSFIDNLRDEAKIADIGCGTGGQTMVLARHTPGQITGLDLFAEFIDIFNAHSRKLDLQDRVTGIVGSMADLPFEKETLDLIWSEGAIYNIGFQRGLNQWHKLLKKGAFIAVSEASWFTEKRPDEIDRFWKEAYAEIDLISTKVKQMEEAGYVPVATFSLPEPCWTDHFYTPQVAVQEKFLQRYPGNPKAAELVENQRREAELYHRYKAYYGYVFYIGT